VKCLIKRTLYIQLYYFLFASQAFAYLDPGTGSYVFQILIAAFIGGLFTIKMFWQKIKNFFSNYFSGKQEK
jgi:hypothetical protein